MDYKTILVHSGTDAAADSRLNIAAELANTFDGHLIGAALTGISPYVMRETAARSTPLLEAECRRRRGAAASCLDRYASVCSRQGVASFERLLIDDEEADELVARAAGCDLVVLGQTDEAPPVPVSRPGLAEQVLLRSGRPALVVPYTMRHADTSGHIVVAWDASPEANRALACSLPLLRVAGRVTIVSFSARGSWPHDDPARREAHVAAYLRRHGITATSLPLPAVTDVADALLSLAADHDAGMLVMGAYGHARFRELLLGGVTATILASMTLPVLFSH